MAHPQHAVQHKSCRVSHATTWWEMVWPCVSPMGPGRLTPSVLLKVILIFLSISLIQHIKLHICAVESRSMLMKITYFKLLCLIWFYWKLNFWILRCSGYARKGKTTTKHHVQPYTAHHHVYNHFLCMQQVAKVSYRHNSLLIRSCYQHFYHWLYVKSKRFNSFVV